MSISIVGKGNTKIALKEEIKGLHVRIETLEEELKGLQAKCKRYQQIIEIQREAIKGLRESESTHTGTKHWCIMCGKEVVQGKFNKLTGICHECKPVKETCKDCKKILEASMEEMQ